MIKHCLIIFIALFVCVVITGCARQPERENVTSAQPVAQEPLAPEAQSVLDRLNRQCADKVWQSEIDMIERPATRPKRYVTSGEALGFVSACKEQLAKLGVQVKWNPSKKLYEVKKTQQTDSLEK